MGGGDNCGQKLDWNPNYCPRQLPLRRLEFHAHQLSLCAVRSGGPGNGSNLPEAIHHRCRLDYHRWPGQSVMGSKYADAFGIH